MGLTAGVGAMPQLQRLLDFGAPPCAELAAARQALPPNANISAVDSVLE